VGITALNTNWTQTEVSAPGNVGFTIHFDNQDASTPHNIVIKDGTGMAMFTGDLVTGPAQADYAVPALAPGKYTFVCSVHTSMIGNLTVGQ
jgi:plastocyanin